MRRVTARFATSWGQADECVVQLELTPRNWSKIRKSEGLFIRGKGFRSGGEFFWDYWHFSGGLDDTLEVSWGSPKDRDYSARGFIGFAREVLVYLKFYAGSKSSGVDLPYSQLTKASAFQALGSSKPAVAASFTETSALSPDLLDEAIEKYVGAWRHLHRSKGSGFAYGMHTTHLAGILRKYLKRYFATNGQFPNAIYNFGESDERISVVDFGEITKLIEISELIIF